MNFSTIFKVREKTSLIVVRISNEQNGLPEQWTEKRKYSFAWVALTHPHTHNYQKEGKIINGGH